MATIKATDALKRLNAEHGCDINYIKFNRLIASGQVPAERDDDGRSWVIREGDLDDIATRLRAAPARRTRSAA